jgi:hypothetical protein
MAHKFRRVKNNIYSDAAHQIENYVFVSIQGYEGGAGDELYDVLSNAVVSALGDVAAQAFRNGVSDPKQIKALAHAVSHMSEEVLGSYEGEVDPEGVLKALESDPRLASLPDENRERLKKEIEKTRQLEHLLLEAKRIPDLIDFAGELGLRVPDDLIAEGTVLLGEHPTLTSDTT